MILIWFKPYTLDEIESVNSNTMATHLAIKFVDIGDDYLKAKMPVDATTIQPGGVLHGGASVALAETIGSVGSNLLVDLDKHICVGLEINANHVKSVKSGYVFGVGKPISVKEKTQVWDIKIFDDFNNLICISRLTMAILNK